MALGFQTQVGVVPAPAVEGDFASTNPRFTVDAGPGALVAGASGVRVGWFAWASSQVLDPDGSPAIANNFGSGPVTGFVGRAQQGLITTYLADASMTIPTGFMVTLFSGGDFWVKNNGTTQAALGQKAYANLGNGQVSFAATAAPSTASITGSIAALTSSFTGSIAGNVLNVSALSSGTLTIGAAVAGSGVAAGTTIVSQLSGTIGGVGTYALNIGEQTVASEGMTTTYGVLTVSAVASGTVGVGGLLTGSGVAANTSITGLGTGAGGTGTYYLNNTQTVGSEALTLTTNVETKWIAMSAGLPGELVKISSHPLG
jgi:hypothetical protein